MKTPIYVDNKCVGEVENGIFRKRITDPNQKLRIPPGFGLQITSIEDAEKAGATSVYITDLDGVVYRMDTAKVKTFQPQDRGYGMQYIVPLNYFDLVGVRPQP